METAEKVFRTGSLPAAAFIVASGYRIPHFEEASDRAVFVFPDPHGTAAQVLDDYINGEKVSARDYYRALQDIRYAMNNRAAIKACGAR
jgi:hypothetical protein